MDGQKYSKLEKYSRVLETCEYLKLETRLETFFKNFKTRNSTRTLFMNYRNSRVLVSTRNSKIYSKLKTLKILKKSELNTYKVYGLQQFEKNLNA